MSIVDVHHHWMPKEHLENIETYLRVGEKIVKDKDGIKVFRENIPVFRPDKKKYPYVEEHLRDMDQAKVNMAVLSISIFKVTQTN